MRRLFAWTSAVALAVGLASVPPVAGAQNTQTTSSFDTTCYIDAPSMFGVGGPMDITPQNPVQIHVTSPESVDVGDRFDVTFDIDPINVALDSLPPMVSLKEASRLKLDLQRPAGTKLISSRFSGGNIDVSQARILTVNEAGAPDANGDVLRLTSSGHDTIGNGGNASQTSHEGLGMDLSGKSSLDFEFPQVTLTLEAERAGAADIGVRTKGNAAGYGPNAASFLTLLASVDALGNKWVPGYCSPRGSASAPIDQTAASMKSIDIIGLPTSAALEGPETVYLRTPAEFVTTVDPKIAGEVAFVSEGQRVTVPVNTATGEARAQLTFNNATTGPVTAIFIPTNPRYATAVSELMVTPERLPTEMTLDAPATTDANTRTALSVQLPADARGTVAFSGGGQERTVDVRDGQAATSLTFTEVGETTVEAVFTPSSTSAYASVSASASIMVEESTSTTLILNGLDVPAYVAEPVTLEAIINPAEGTTDPQGRVEFAAGTETQLVDLVDGRATAEFIFGRAGAVEASATYHPAGTDQTRASDSGTLEIVDAQATNSDLVGPATVEPSTPTPYTIVVSPAGAGGTADVRIDGRIVATDLPIVDGEGSVSLSFPPAAAADRAVTVDFTPSDPRALRPHSAEHTVRVETSPIDEGALTMTVTGPEDSLVPGESAPFRVSVAPTNELESPATLNGYLTVANNGEVVLDANGEPVRIAVTRGSADVDVTWTGSYPQSKYLQFTYHSADGTERTSGGITVTVIGEGTDDDGVSVTPGTGGGSGSLDLGSLMGDAGSLTASLGS